MRRYSIFILLFVFSMCSWDTKVYKSTFHRKYKDGKSIEVVREDEVTKWTGIITKTDYGSTNTFTYHFNVEPDDYEWQGLINQVPLALLFCGEETYLKATERLLKFDSLYATEGHYKDTTLYFKNVDERYFFKLLGNQYFVDADSVSYQASKAKCGEVSVPVM